MHPYVPPCRSRRSCLARAAIWLRNLGFVGALAGTAAAAVPIVQVSPTVYNTEHCLFIIDATVNWANPTQAYSEIYSPANGGFPRLSSYFDTLTGNFPATYFSVCYLAATGAGNVPNYIDQTYKASGINEPGTAGAPQSFTTVDFCRYNLGTNVLLPALAVFDHELGHAWGAQLFHSLTPPILANGHWLSNSTVDCQLAATYSDDGQASVNKIYGDPTSGFRWQRVDNLHSNDTETFSEQQLYLMGVEPTFPTSYVLNGPVYSANGTMGYTSVDTFDHAQAVARYGARNPDYITSAKQFRLGFVYVARDAAEVTAVYAAVERSIDHYCNAETIDSAAYRFQVPFLSAARYRASVVGRLADLDGNTAPSLTVPTPYVTSATGDASVGFSATDTAGSPAVTLVPASTHATVGSSVVHFTGLPDGVHFLTLKAQDAGGKKTYAHFVVEVHRAAASLTIAAPPAGVTAVAGTTASFVVAATGIGTNRTYQWMRQAAGTSTWNDLVDGNGVTGATTATLNLVASTAMNRDEVLCLVTDSTGSVTTQRAVLIVNEVAPSITTQPVDRLLASGNAAHFDTVVAGAPMTYGYFSYQWQRALAGTTTWTDIANGGGVSGASTAALTIGGTTTGMSGEQYRCRVTNTAGVTTSATATLTVHQRPSITTQPVAVTIDAGETATFTVVAGGTPPLSYQWSRYGVVLPGATAATLTLTNVQDADAGAYTVTVSNAVGTAGSNVGSLVVTAAAPTVSAQPQSLTTSVGAAVSFTVTAAGTTPFTYQWKKNGAVIAGATGTSLSFSNVQSADAADYTVVVTNSLGSVTSAIAALTVTALAVAPTITTPPQSVTAPAGQSALFSVTAAGSAPLSYQWRKNGSPLAGATAATLTLASIQPADAGNYSVVVTNSAGTMTSSAATLTVTAAVSAPVIVHAPVSTSATVGQSISFTVTAAGTAPLAYQWRKDGVVLTGATSSTLVLGAVSLAQTGDYSVVVTNDAGTIASASARLDVTVVLQSPQITVPPRDTTVVAGATATFTVTAPGATSYQWWHDGAPVSGATGSTLTVAAVQAPDCGGYSVVVTNPAGAATSASAILALFATDFSGSYFGSFGAGGEGGEFGFVLQPNGTGTLLARLASVRRAVIASDVRVDRNGSFTLGSVDGPTGTSAEDGRRYTAEITGQISGGGLRLAVPGLGLTGSAARATAVAVSAANIGLSQGVPVGRGAGEVCVEVSESGQALLVVLDPSIARSTWTTVNSTGELQATVGAGPGARSFRGTLNGGRFTGTATDAMQATIAYVPAAAPNATRLVNISTRGFAGEGDRTLIAGFVVTGSGTKDVLIRAIGPTLSSMGVADAVANPHLTLFHHGSAVLDNDDWGAAAGDVAGQADLVGAFPLTRGSRDSALLVALTPGNYSAHAAVPSASPGVAMIEVYDAGRSGVDAPKLLNISSRAFVGQGEAILIAGFAIRGEGPQRVLIRGAGPALVPLGVRDSLADPQLKVFHGSTVIAVNDDWEAGAETGLIASVGSRVGAFAFPAGSKDAALLAYLEPGVYTVHLGGAHESTGVGMLEVYDVTD